MKQEKVHVITADIITSLNIGRRLKYEQSQILAVGFINHYS